MSVSNLGGDDLTAPTNAARDPWQEAISRWQTVPMDRVAQAAEVIRGMAGSWAASYQFDYGSKNGTQSLGSSPEQVKSNRLGQPGFPELNFVPYNYGTNRFGPKGGSFVGHPISFEVVGPTARSPAADVTGLVSMDWYWGVDVSGSQDELLFHPANGGIFDMADVFVFPDLTMFPGGLYVVITQTGSGSTLEGESGATMDGGIGDGFDITAGGTKNGIIPNDANSKYEIFRVVGMRAGAALILDSGKRLADYFTIPADPIIRSIMLVQPKATRLVAVPGSGANGKTATAFAVVPPKRAAMQDDILPYATWSHDFYEKNLPQYHTTSSNPLDLFMGPQLPIPRPLAKVTGRLAGIDPLTGLSEGPVTPGPAGWMFMWVFSPMGLDHRILRITSVRSRNGAVLRPDTTGTGSDFVRPLESIMGYFEVIYTFNLGGGVQAAALRRVAETDPTTGFSVIGATEWYTVDDTDPQIGKTIEFEATVHDNIERLWDGSYPDIDAIQSARLTNLIDPRWVERHAKVMGQTPARADRAVFDTASTNAGADGHNANPGNLMDLGFRMVLYRAKVGTEWVFEFGHPPHTREVLIPDWDNPVTANEIPLYGDDVGGGVTFTYDKQYVEVDYANGLVRFSRPITHGPLYPQANVFTSGDNPRGEMVLFACCVPYTQEEGQLGSGVRVQGNQTNSLSCDFPQGEPTDVFSSRIMAPVDVTSPLIVSRNHIAGQTIILSGDWVYKIPASGFVELLVGASTNAIPVIGDTNYRGSLFGYTSVSIDAGRTLTTLHDVYGGGEYGVATWNPAALPTVAVFRREVVTPNDIYGDAGVAYQFDTTYGASKRAEALRFDGADVTANIDGTVTIRPREADATGTFDDVFSSWVLEKGNVSQVIDPGVSVTVTVEPHVILMRGHRMTIPTSTVVLTVADSYYIYYEHNDGTKCPQCLATTDFPLPHPEDILLARVSVRPGITVSTLLALQNPMNDVDRRVDLYVGEIGGDTGDWVGFQPHFTTLAEAVEYANEIMAPVSGGRAYQNVTIHVVGRTHEPSRMLPIVIRANGLVIEGTPSYNSNSAVAVKSEISWGADPNITDLIDLNGCSDLVFRNLSFRSNGHAYNPGCTASVFTCSHGDPTSIIIDNCRSVGCIKHFVNLNSIGSFTNPGYVFNCKITNNVVGDVMGDCVSLVSDTRDFDGMADAALGGASTITLDGTASSINNFYINSFVTIVNALPAGIVTGESHLITAYNGTTKVATLFEPWTTVPDATTTVKIRGRITSGAFGLLIQGNLFSADTDARSSDGIAIHCITEAKFMDSMTISDGIVIRDNTLGYFRVGIFAISQSGEIANNLILATHSSGMITCGGWEIRNNTLSHIHSDAPPSAPNPVNFRTGILHYTYQREALGATGHGYLPAVFSGQVIDNRVHLDYNNHLDVLNDKAICVLGSPNPNNSFTFVENYLAQVGGAVDEIKLNAASSAVDDYYLGCQVMILDGTGAGEFGQITAYDGGTKIAKMSIVWVNPPNATSFYRIDRLHRGIGEIVDGNFAGYVSDVLIRNDQSNLRVHAKGAKVGNNVGALLEVWGTENNVTGNTIGQMGIDYDVVNTSPSSDRAYDDVNMVSGNTVSGVFFPWAGTIARGNHFVGDVNFLDGNRCIISDNTFDGSLTIGTTIQSNLFTVSGNRIGIGGLLLGASDFPVNNATITGNQIPDTGILTWSNSTNYTGNNLSNLSAYGGFTIEGAYNVVSGNITGALSTTGLYNMITGNQLTGDLTVVTGSAWTSIGQNAVQGAININSHRIMITGNVASSINFATDNLVEAIVNGNMVSGDIVLGSSPAGQVDPVVIVGNIVGGVGGISAHPAKLVVPSYIIVANATKAVFTAGTVAANALADNQDI